MCEEVESVRTLPLGARRVWSILVTSAQSRGVSLQRSRFAELPPLWMSRNLWVSQVSRSWRALGTCLTDPQTQNFLPCRVPSAWNNWQSSQLKRKLDCFVESRVGLSPQPFPSQQVCVQAHFFVVSTAEGRKLFVRLSRGAALLHNRFQCLPLIRRVCSLKTWLGMYFTLCFPNSWSILNGKQ